MSYDKYELQAIVDNQATINEFGLLKTTQGSKGKSKLIYKGKRTFLALCYYRADDPYFLELSLSDCKKLMGK